MVGKTLLLQQFNLITRTKSNVRAFDQISTSRLQLWPLLGQSACQQVPGNSLPSQSRPSVGLPQTQYDDNLKNALNTEWCPNTCKDQTYRTQLNGFFQCSSTYEVGAGPLFHQCSSRVKAYCHQHSEVSRMLTAASLLQLNSGFPPFLASKWMPNRVALL